MDLLPVNKYDVLMQQILEFIQGTWLAEQPIAGCTDEEIARVEQSIGKKFPAALTAWYRCFGKHPPQTRDYDMDFSLADLMRAQNTARIFTEMPDSVWRMPANFLPFSQRTGDQMLMLDLSTGDDPVVYHYLEGEDSASYMSIAFSAYMREGVLEWLNTHPYHNPFHAVQRTPESEPRSRQDLWVLDDLKRQIGDMRQAFVERIHNEDAGRDSITEPGEFQQRWMEYFTTTEVWQRMKDFDLTMPFGWITPPGRK